jgi:hypothetical protein
MLPRRRVVSLRLAGLLLRPGGFFAEPLEWSSPDRSMTRTLPLLRASCTALWVPFLFRVGTRDIMMAALEAAMIDDGGGLD